MLSPEDQQGIPRIIQLENILSEILDFLVDESIDLEIQDEELMQELTDLIESGQEILAREGDEDDLAAYE